ncbi:catalase [Burkholderiales bacterium JOSHI_001]|nr:catalase [Burkholderiales bacterium JOSHI_001]
MTHPTLDSRTAATLTSNQGTPVSDNQNSLRAGERGPSLLEDFLLREKITHFDHERIPERIVHARGSAAHGHFECLRDCSDWTRAGFLSRKGLRTPVFARLSTVAGGAGSADTVRDVRGFAVKFYTDEGNFDLVGNNIPVFFIQDAIKFPDLVHAVKMEPDRGFPQAASAHDTFWDFISLMPESLHMVMWAMSMRSLPRSLRMVDGFGVHSFRFVNAQGESRFVKFHWRAELGVECLTWDEAVKIAGADPDYHRRDLWQAIEGGQHPSWLLEVQVFDELQAATLPFDVLDATKLVPEELVPLLTIGRMVLDRNPVNFFAETEQVAFCPAHLVPGIDFSDDPLLQGRLFSYTDTQLSRLGSPNFHQLPVNRARCPVHNFQRDGHMQMNLPSGRVNYEPQSLDPQAPRESADQGFRSAPISLEGAKLRVRSASFADHVSAARQFFHSQTLPEQRHIVNALAFELGKLEIKAIRQRMLGQLALIDETLLRGVADKLGVDPSSVPPATPATPPRDLPPLPSLSVLARRGGTLQGRCVGLLVADGADAGLLAALQRALAKVGARTVLVAERRGGPTLATGDRVEASQALDAAPSCLFDHVLVLGDGPGVALLASLPAARAWLQDAWRHLKVIGLDSAALQLADAAGIGRDDGVVVLTSRKSADSFCQRAAHGKVFTREGAPGTDA